MENIEYVQSMSGKLEDVEIGTTLYFTKTVSESDVYLFSGVTGDFSPNHVDEEYMKQGMYGERLAHGALMVGFMSAASSRMRIGRTVSLGYDRVRFTAPVKFGDTITTKYTIIQVDLEKKRIYNECTCTNQRGETVGSAVHLRAFVD
ncbi:MaoC family dehydratase [Cupriavidus sp. D39]|uniref:MaoC family dehydratase n=1 Tax=Cupriavidus sp. D39 TaxID=2997877 RepID=UPI0022721B5C|nr:MaoC family dehydratase [Cupriavidus sp. D39]MCY0852788.1 MaoC family dehydratase [Cupriavidus sp. D39]